MSPHSPVKTVNPWYQEPATLIAVLPSLCSSVLYMWNQHCRSFHAPIILNQTPTAKMQHPKPKPPDRTRMSCGENPKALHLEHLDLEPVLSLSRARLTRVRSSPLDNWVEQCCAPGKGGLEFRVWAAGFGAPRRMAVVLIICKWHIRVWGRRIGVRVQPNTRDLVVCCFIEYGHHLLAPILHCFWGICMACTIAEQKCAPGFRRCRSRSKAARKSQKHKGLKPTQASQKSLIIRHCLFQHLVPWEGPGKA